MSEYSLFADEPEQEPEIQDAPEVAQEPSEPAPIAPQTTQQDPEWTTQLRGLKNLVDNVVHCPVYPWAFTQQPPLEALKSKESFGKWGMKSTTDHLYFTGMEGLNPLTRINKENPVAVIHAIVCDYDGIVTDENIEGIKLKLSDDLLPTYVSKTRFSGGCRMVWMFKSPLEVGVGNLADNFLKQANRALSFNRLAAGFDPQSLKTSQTFEVGTDWRKIGGPLRDEAVHSWLFKACVMRDTRLGDRNDVKIPIRDVAQEVERQFPGRWGGNFDVGQRGVVFFDPTSVNPSASIITEDGMVCFGQAKTFYPWKEILGETFTRQYGENQIYNATHSIYSDGQEAWRRNIHDSGKWERVTLARLEDQLIEEFGIKDEALRRARYTIDRMNRIKAAVPFVGNNKEIIVNAHGDRLLNTRCHLKVVQPASGHSAGWGDGFPFLREFFDTRPDKEREQNEFSKWHLLAWWSVFYKGVLNGDLDLGQAIAIVGGTGTGKTLWAKRMLAPSVGGTSNAGTYLKGLTHFNSDLFESAVWLVDDDALTQDAASRDRFSKMLKACASTESMEYHAKGKNKVLIEWAGRAVILMNADPESILSIPSLNISNSDKFCLYRWREHTEEFAPQHILEPMIEKELPYLLRWLVEMNPKDYGIETSARFGIKSYIERDTAAEAERASGAGSFQEIIEQLVFQNDLHGKADVNPVMFLSMLSSNEALRILANKYTPQTIGKQFRVLASMPDPIVDRSLASKGMWSIDCDKVRGMSVIPQNNTTVDLSA